MYLAICSTFANGIVNYRSQGIGEGAVSWWGICRKNAIANKKLAIAFSD
ncbi:MAG: hypothetical protein RMX96_03905 [Nostoc sp. ChiSLP02]|nr:hypothetical protein [Nostoc sp. DedSLP05]MDZ8100231.1 hypothetical protein [Nostoc sp. DedSLP01]MDZ8183991.1 hypothetical protein [Nostoc sp. ChiSLP02]